MEIILYWLGALAVGLGYFFYTAIYDSGPLPSSHHNVGDINSKLTSANKPVSKSAEDIVVVLLDLLRMQASMMRTLDGEKYLKSDFSIGFVAGFTDAFLQRAQRTKNLSSADQHGIMGAMIDGIFADIDPKALDRCCDLQDRGGNEFMAGQLKGGQGAFAYLNNPSDPKAQMCWFADFTEKHTSQDDMAATASEAPEYPSNTDAEGYAVTLSEHIRHGLKRFENDTNEVEIPRYIIEDLYLSGFVVGYLAIVIDGMEREQNKTKEDRGLFSTEFYRRLDKDIGTQLVKLLEDLDYAKATAQYPTFQEGRDHGSLWAAHYFGLARQELHDQVLKDAKAMSERHGIDLVNCLFLLTFWDRYKR